MDSQEFLRHVAILNRDDTIAWPDGLSTFSGVATNGCFDVIHAGHVRLLALAASFGNVVVGLNSDASVSRLKGRRRPIHSFGERKAVLESIRHVSCVVEIDDAADWLASLSPKLYIKGPEVLGMLRLGFAPSVCIPGAVDVLRAGGSVLLPDWDVTTSTTKIIAAMQRGTDRERKKEVND